MGDLNCRNPGKRGCRIEIGQRPAEQSQFELADMNKATRATASFLGIYAGLLGMEHGFFEILQGSTPTSGLVIHAIGPPCQTDMAWHACLPALTLIPTYFITGVLALFAGLAVLVWAAGYVHRERGGLILILLSLLMLLVGGGFVSCFIGVIAGVAGTRINAPLTWWRARPRNVLRLLAICWPWTAIVLGCWFPAAWILGYYFNQPVLELSMMLFFIFDLGFPVLTVISGFAWDTQRFNSM